MSKGRRYIKTDNQNFFNATAIALVKSGEDFFNKALDIINRSHKSLHFQTYIFSNDETGQLIIDALKAAVKRGVKVFLLVDAFGSNSLSNAAIDDMQKGGIHFKKYSPLFSKHHIRFGRRLHHKIIIGDETESLIGGINVENKYRLKGKESPWLDYAVYVAGSVCKNILPICQSLWKGKTFRLRRKKIFHLPGTETDTEVNIPAKVLQNDWLFRKEAISLSLRRALRKSNSSVTLMASYFLPGRRIRKLLRNASKRNVKIQVILQGTSDVTLTKKATTYLYAWMLRNNIEIYEWNKTILHGKISLIDNNWISIGSYNINHLSDYSSIETNLEVSDIAFCQTVQQELESVIQNSHRITYSEYHHKMNPWQQFTCWFSFYFTRLLFKVQFAILSRE